MKTLLLTAFSRFFVMGVTLVGLPFLVRTVLGLDAKFYGGAESALAVAEIERENIPVRFQYCVYKKI